MRRFILAVTCVALTCTFAFSDTLTGRITKVDGTKITFEKSKGFNADTKKLEYEAPQTLEAVNKDIPVTTKAGGKGAGGKKGGGGKGGDPTPVEGGLNADMFKNIDKEKGVNVTLTTEDAGANKGKVSAITVGGKGGAGKGKKGG